MINTRMKLILSAFLTTGVVACAATPTAPEAPTVETSVEEEQEEKHVAEDDSFTTLLSGLASGEHRDPANIERNAYRNPVETLSFFGLQPDSTVVELSPGHGWYTEILAPALAERGKLIVAYPDGEVAEGYFARIVESYEGKLASAPEIYGKVERAWLHPGHRIDFGEPESADLVVTFRNIHGWYNREQIGDILAEVHNVLKPDGIFGVVQHRAQEDASSEEVSKTGYLPQAFVVELIQAHGFELVDSSEVNANPVDTKDHPEGVWTLPPALRLGDVDRDKYTEIGESDRMTMKFRKVTN